MLYDRNMKKNGFKRRKLNEYWECEMGGMLLSY
jgi:hypothetical protein